MDQVHLVQRVRETRAVGSIADLNKSVSLDSGGNDFVRIAKTLAAAGGKLDVARRMVSQAGTNPRVREAIENGIATKEGWCHYRRTD
jgi:hypothetical protein